MAAMFEERLGIPTALTNDANAAAIGEMTYGAARGMKDFIMITLGTGVGSGIVINGQMVYGHDGFAGELGHVIARRDGRLCGCGRKGCLETYCSATGVARTAREFLAARTDASLLRNIPAENITSKDVYDAAVQGDKLAQEIFEFTGNILGEALAVPAPSREPSERQKPLPPCRWKPSCWRRTAPIWPRSRCAAPAATAASSAMWASTSPS